MSKTHFQLCTWAIIASGLFCTSPLSAQSTATIVRVEEDWSVQINLPDANTSSPQIATQMNPHVDYPNTYALYCLNYKEIPTFFGGGMEIQLWEGNQVLDVDAYSAYEISTENETILWTQAMEIKDGKMSFSVTNGSSQSFGQFGGESFKVTQSTVLVDLGNYSVQDSIDNSGIVFGANRVQSLKIVEVRYIKSDGTVVTDSQAKIVYDASVGSN